MSRESLEPLTRHSDCRDLKTLEAVGRPPQRRVADPV